MSMDPQRCRTVMIDGIVRALSARIFGPTQEQRAVLSAARQVIESDQSVVEKIAALVGPYQQESQSDDQGQVYTFEYGPLVVDVTADNLVSAKQKLKDALAGDASGVIWIIETDDVRARLILQTDDYEGNWF